MTVFKDIKAEFVDWSRAFLRAIPGRIGITARNKFYGYQAGHKSRVLGNVVIYYPELLVIGRNSTITTYCQLNAGGGITIGNDVLIGPGTVIWSQNHLFEDAQKPVRLQGYERKPVFIEDDVWVASRVVIVPGVRLAKGTVVAAGAVVTRSTDPYTVVAGVPARVIGARSKGEQIIGSELISQVGS